jgi:hypothetical protein
VPVRHPALAFVQDYRQEMSATLRSVELAESDAPDPDGGRPQHETARSRLARLSDAKVVVSR